jgi:transposase-like protein
MYLCRAIDCVGDTAKFWFGEQGDLTSAKRFFRKGPGASWLRFQ